MRPASGGAIRCQLAQVYTDHTRRPEIRVIRYWHEWLDSPSGDSEGDEAINKLVEGLSVNGQFHIGY